jgi:formylglycine-generating enzyme required for sulfatase activity
MVFYSAGAGQTSLDSLGESDRGANGLFTRVLLAEMQIPGIPVDRMLRNVRDEVARLAKGAGHDQVPALYDQAPGDFYLRPLATGTVAFGIPKLAHGTLRSDGAMEEEKTQALAAVAPEPPVGTHAGSMDASGLQAQDGNTQGFRDCAECPVLARIPAGNFEMGAPSHEVGRFDSEGPIHRVNVQGFALARTHVTRGEFSDFVDATGYPAGNSCFAFEGGQFEDRPNRSWRDPGFRQDNTHPAVCINWSDAKAYADWLSRKTGKSYRLPTEAEWEYAARAGTTTARYWGENPDLACTYANVGDQAAKSIVPVADVHNCSDGYAYTSPAGSFKPNAFGLYDMLGNAMQWTEDCHHENYDGAPADARAWAGGDCKMRELRGGSWFDLPRFVRAANRGGFDAAKRASVIGFRVARTLP